MKATPIQPSGIERKTTGGGGAAKWEAAVERIQPGAIVAAKAAQLKAEQDARRNAQIMKVTERLAFIARVREEAEAALQARIRNMDRAPKVVLQFRDAVLAIDGYTTRELAQGKRLVTLHTVHAAIHDAAKYGHPVASVALAWCLDKDDIEASLELRGQERGLALAWASRARAVALLDESNPEYAEAYIGAIVDCGESHPLPKYKNCKRKPPFQTALLERVIKVGKKAIERCPTIDRAYLLYRLSVIDHTAAVAVERGVWGDVRASVPGGVRETTEVEA
jgi:hypothetical protein